MLPSSQTTLCEIARAAMKVVSELLEDDQRFAQNIRSDDAHSHQFVREEHFTTDLARQLLRDFPGHVEMTLFTPAEEVKTGADWYWQFRKGERAIHAFVQAKRVRRQKLGEPDAKGSIPINWSQLQTLRAYGEAKRRSLPGLQTWLASYARLDASPPCALEPCRCPNHGCQSCPNSIVPSIWIERLEDLLAAHRGTKTSAISVPEMVTGSVRLDCLLPCIAEGQLSLGVPGPGVKGLNLSPDVPTFARSVGIIERDIELSSVLTGALYLSA